MLILYLSGARTSTSGPKARINWSSSRVGVVMYLDRLYTNAISQSTGKGSIDLRDIPS